MAHNEICMCRYATPAGGLILGSYGRRLCLCDWEVARHRKRIDYRLSTYLKATIRERRTAVIDQAIAALEEYFAGERRRFDDIALQFAGTVFQQRVWYGLMQTPYGKTLSYGELAAIIGAPTAIRAVANATGANALSIFVPCHRIIGCNGKLTGYAGGLDAKRTLLAVEGVNIDGR